ncbi:hypothetical protein C2R22_03825 [Salinigranum rubrum]|uniref:Uncharacterized protein n=1 Tax=Salinigranum rubrum TaxID=755307 RepID=A0A2I8VG33_9EURY|nr:hypothetical protein [Salinigranum rubrum]AUV80893.1 hypothetical protein C2R22_03825 [Salinigranum rubrum]
MPRETDRFRIAIVGVLALALGASALTGAAAAQTDSPTIRVESATVQPGETATVDVVLTSAPKASPGSLSTSRSETATPSSRVRATRTRSG